MFFHVLVCFAIHSFYGKRAFLPCPLSISSSTRALLFRVHGSSAGAGAGPSLLLGHFYLREIVIRARARLFHFAWPGCFFGKGDFKLHGPSFSNYIYKLVAFGINFLFLFGWQGFFLVLVWGWSYQGTRFAVHVMHVCSYLSSW